MPIDNGVMTIAPDDIPTPEGGHFFDAFGNYETEISARWLVRFAKQRGKGWEPFTLPEIEKFYNEDGGYQGFRFNNLIPGGWIVEVPKGTVGVEEDTFHFTEEFITRCHKAATKG